MSKTSTLALALFMAATPMVIQDAYAADAVVPPDVFIAAQTPDQYLAHDRLLGAKVHGPDDKIIGSIDDLIVDGHNVITGVVIGAGGLAGISEKQIGVDVHALKFIEKDGKQEVSLPAATSDVLAAVPAFTRTAPQKSLSERAIEQTQELKEKAAASAKSATDNAKPALEKAAEKSLEVYEKAKEAAKPAYEAAKDAVNKAVDKASKAMDKATAPSPETPAPAPAPAP